MDKNNFNNENEKKITAVNSDDENTVQNTDTESEETVIEYNWDPEQTKRIDIVGRNNDLEKTILYDVPQQNAEEPDEPDSGEIIVTHNSNDNFIEEDQPVPGNPKRTNPDEDIDALPEITAVKPSSDEFIEKEQPVPKMTRHDKKLEKERLKAQKKYEKHQKRQHKPESAFYNDKPVIKMTDIRAARNKEKKKKRIKKLVIILIIAALAATAVLTKNMWVGKLEGILDKPHQIIVNDGKTDGKNFPVSRDSTSVNFISTVENYPVTADDSHVYVYNEDGTIYNTFVLNMISPVIKVADKRILVFDNGGKTFKVYSKKDEIYSKTIDQSILYAVLGDNSNVAVVTQTEKYPACLTVFDKNGSEIYRWSSGQRIMDVSFDDSGNGCYITTFSSVKGQIRSVVHHIKFNSSDESMTSQELDSLVIDTYENNNGDIWAVGSEKFYKLNKKGEILLEYEYTDDLVSYYLNDSSAAVVVNGTGNGSASVAIFDSDSDKEEPAMTSVSHGSPKRLFASGRKVLLLNENSIDAFDLNGNCLATAEIQNEYIDFVYINDSVYLLGYREINKIAFNT